MFTVFNSAGLRSPPVVHSSGAKVDIAEDEVTPPRRLSMFAGTALLGARHRILGRATAVPS